MIKIAIVEDERAASALLEEHLARFTAERGVSFDVRLFVDGADFLTGYQADYQIVLMDIEMPCLNGMEAAKRLRAVDPSVALVFITNMAQYAIKGYEVDALDFVLKPVSYYRFSSLLQKLLRRMQTNREQELTIRTPGGLRRLPASRIAYVAVEDHLLIYHTEEGVIEAWGSLKSAFAGLPKQGFIQINKSCIAGLRHVRAVVGDKLLIGETELPISRGRKQAVLAALNQFLER